MSATSIRGLSDNDMREPSRDTQAVDETHRSTLMIICPRLVYNLSIRKDVSVSMVEWLTSHHLLTTVVDSLMTIKNRGSFFPAGRRRFLDFFPKPGETYVYYPFHGPSGSEQLPSEDRSSSPSAAVS